MLPLLLCTLMLVCLSACDGGEGGGETTTEPQGDETTLMPNAAEIVLSGCRIVRGRETTAEIYMLADELRDELRAKTGESITVTSDDAAAYDPSAFEILLGPTSRPESRLVMGTLKHKEYSISVVGNKLVIYANDDEWTEKAVNYFLKHLGKNTAGELIWSGEYKREVQYEIGKLTLGDVEAGKYSVVYAAETGAYGRLVAELISDRIMEKSGYMLEVLRERDAEDAERRIYISDPTGAGYDYELRLESDGITVLSGCSVSALTAAEKLCALLDGKTGDVSIDEDTVNAVSGSAEQGFAGGKDGADIRVMSSNVLFSDKGIYNNNDRMRLLAECYLTYLPDVIGLQEARAEQINALMEYLSDEYAAVELTSPDGAVYQQILYRKNLYSVSEQGFQRFREKVMPWGVSWAILENTSSGKQFAITNTHLTVMADTYDPGKDNATDGVIMRRENCEAVAAVIERIRQKDPNMPIISTGDWNTPHNGEALLPMMEVAGMQNSYDVAEKKSNSTSNTGHTIDQLPLSNSYRIDHIFTSGELRVAMHSIVVNSRVVCGSDHCPIYADIIF